MTRAGASLGQLLRKSLLALAALGFLLSPAAAKPTRIVSMNVCVDQLLLLLVEKERIASLSYAATNPAMSYLASLAEGLPQNYGRAEEVLPLDPDLVLSGAYTSRATAQLLTHLGFRVVDVADALSLDDIRANIRLVAAAVEEEERGEALIAAFDARLAESLPGVTGRMPRAAFLSIGLYAFGQGTLIDDLLTHTGFVNLPRELGSPSVAPMALELLALNPPDLFLFGREGGNEPSLSAVMMEHPVLKRLMATRRHAIIPGEILVCGAPVAAEAAITLKNLHQELAP